MPRIDVDVEATVGSTIGRAEAVGHSLFARTHDADGWPVGWGRVAHTINEQGTALEAVVLMTEPALPGHVHAWPIGVIELADRARTQILACVAEVPPFIDLIDLAHPAPWHADADAWLHALRRLHPYPGSLRHVCRLHDRYVADGVVEAAQRRFTDRAGATPPVSSSR